MGQFGSMIRPIYSLVNLILTSRWPLPLFLVFYLNKMIWKVGIPAKVQILLGWLQQGGERRVNTCNLTQKETVLLAFLHLGMILITQVALQDANALILFGLMKQCPCGKKKLITIEDVQQWVLLKEAGWKETEEYLNTKLLICEEDLIVVFRISSIFQLGFVTLSAFLFMYLI